MNRFRLGPTSSGLPTRLPMTSSSRMSRRLPSPRNIMGPRVCDDKKRRSCCVERFKFSGGRAVGARSLVKKKTESRAQRHAKSPLGWWQARDGQSTSVARQKKFARQETLKRSDRVGGEPGLYSCPTCHDFVLTKTDRLTFVGASSQSLNPGQARASTWGYYRYDIRERRETGKRPSQYKKFSSICWRSMLEIHRHGFPTERMPHVGHTSTRFPLVTRCM